MSSNSIGSLGFPLPAAAAGNGSGSTGSGPNQLGESAFLTLLSAQLRYQNPTQPMSNTQFVAELAQFSMLGAITQQSSTLSSILGALQGQNPLVAASGLIGKTVTTAFGQGTVTGVTSSASGMNLDVAGLGSVPMAQVTGILA